MTPDVIDKKWRLHDDLTVTINDAAPLMQSTHLLVKIHKFPNPNYFVQKVLLKNLN